MPETRRAHSLGGCTTCRRRHIKCDRAQPACRQCTDRSLTCGGYPTDIRWMPPSNGNENPNTKKTEKCESITEFGIRHYLYTEQDRLLMSKAISKNLVQGSVDLSLHEIDAHSFHQTCASEEEHTVGPFAVLNLSTSINDTMNDDTSLEVKDADPSVSMGSPRDCLMTPPGLGISSYADGLLQWSDLFNSNDSLWGLSSEILMNYEAGLDLTPCPQISSPKDTICADTNTLDPEFLHQPEVAPQLPVVDLLGEAGFLIRHFRETVVPQLTIFPPHKPPWDTLNIPAALETLGQLTVLESNGMSHARLANLYSLLACTATHLATTPLTETPNFNSKQYWRVAYDQAYTEAKKNMEISLSTESEGPKKAKFKDQMMALYGMTECAIFSCLHRDARYYLMNAERLLRSRGLSKRKISRKARLLFNVYTWLRIIGESTYVLHDNCATEIFVEAINLHSQPRDSILRENSMATVANSGLRLDDFLLFENLDNNLNIDDPKDHRTDLSDLHLQDSRKSSGSLSLQVYGMSETWLSLVSQTTRLANVMDALKLAQKAGLPVANTILATVQRRELRLENVIQYFVGRSNLAYDQTYGRHTYTYMMRALNSALIILFYRRVRRVHSAILESHVDKVIAALNEFYSNNDDAMIPGPGTLWPAFIAGCEAISKVQREAIWKLVERGESRSGIAPFRMLKDIFSDVWARQDEQVLLDHGQCLPTWMDLLRSRQNWPIFA